MWELRTVTLEGFSVPGVTNGVLLQPGIGYLPTYDMKHNIIIVGVRKTNLQDTMDNAMRTPDDKRERLQLLGVIITKETSVPEINETR